MTADPALDWFLNDAKRQGLTLSEYERRYGVILDTGDRRPSPATLRIRRHEVPGGLATEADIGFAEHKEKRRAIARRETRDMLPAADCD